MVLQDAAVLMLALCCCMRRSLVVAECVNYVNPIHASVGELSCLQQQPDANVSKHGCLTVVIRVNAVGWNFTEGNRKNGLTTQEDDYSDENVTLTEEAFPTASTITVTPLDSEDWHSPFLLNTNRDGEKHLLNVSHPNGSESQYAFVTALRMCWPYDDVACYAKHCIIVVTDLAIANNSRWFVCCCKGVNCNRRTYIVHESGLLRNASGLSSAYTTFRVRVLKWVARRLRTTDTELANKLIDSARRGIQHPNSRGNSPGISVMALLNHLDNEYTSRSPNYSQLYVPPDIVEPSEYDSDEQIANSNEVEESGVRDLILSVFVAALISALVLLALVYFCRKRAAVVRAHVRARRRRHQISTRSGDDRESYVQVTQPLPPYMQKQRDRFVLKYTELRGEELVARGRFCSVWRSSLMPNKLPVAVKVFERQARKVWANEVAVHAHLLAYASSRPELRYAETCTWDELWGIGAANARSTHSSQSVSKCETTTLTGSSDQTAANEQQSEERTLRDTLTLLESVSILKFVGVCVAEPPGDYEGDQPVDLFTAGFRAGSLGYLLVTEYQSLGSLHDFLNCNLLTWRDALRIAHDVAAGLSFLHRSDEAEYVAYVPASSTSVPRVGKAPVAHRDIKSKNVLLRPDLHASIGDFGLAMILDDDARAQLDESTNSALLQCGTRVYMSPELLAAVTRMTRESFIATDVYAFALVLYELLSRTAELRCPLTVATRVSSAYPVHARSSESESAIATDSEDDSRSRRFANARCVDAHVHAAASSSHRCALADATCCVCPVRSLHERCSKPSVYDYGAVASFDEDAQITQANAAFANDTIDTVVDMSKRVARYRSGQHVECDCDSDWLPFTCIYRLPYTRETGCANPDLETLRQLVATQNYRPALIEFDRDALLEADASSTLCRAGRRFVSSVREYCRTVEQGWDVDADARLSAAAICVRMKRLLRDCESDNNAACRCALRFVRARK